MGSASSTLRLSISVPSMDVSAAATSVLVMDPVKLVFGAYLGFQRDLLAFDALGQRFHLGGGLGLAAGHDAALGFVMTFDVIGGHGGQLLGNQEVAGVAVVDLFQLTCLRYIGDVLKKDDFHVFLTSWGIFSLYYNR